MEVSTAEIWTGTRSKRIRGRFRATLAGLLELEVLRVKHKEMVEEALEIQESPDHRDDRVTSHQGPYQYWMEESSFRLKLKRRLSNENLSDPGSFLELRRTGVQHSSADPEDLSSHECEDRQSWVSSGFCENQNVTMSSLTTSLASLSHQSTDTSAVYGEELHTNAIWRSQLLKNKQEHVRKGDTMTQGFSKVVIPEAGFLSVVGLYPESHWPDISDILQPQVVLEPSYRSDLKSRQGSEVYRYPSPLHAVALQSPLFALQSPEHKRKKERCFPGTFSSETSSLLRYTTDFERTRSHPDSTTTLTSLTSSFAYLENPRCEEILLKRVRGEMANHAKAEISGITSWSRRNSTSLHRTCSMGKAGTASSFKSMLFQNRGAGQFDSSRAPSPRFRGRLGTQKNRLRRHTAALTNLSIFTERNGSSSEVFMRGTSICSGISEPIC